MQRLSFSSLRLRLLLIVAVAIIPALGLMIYTASEQRRVAAIEVQETALRLARLASANQEQLIEGARQILIILAELPEVRMQDSRGCDKRFAELLKKFPLYANFGAIKPNGDIFCSARPTSGPINAADRAYFQRTLKTRDFAVGEYQIGRITGKASVNLSYPVLGNNGAIQAVVFAALDLAWLNQLIVKAELPQEATLSVIDRNGTILAHYPDAEKWIGKSTSKTILNTVLVRHEGIGEDIRVDGTASLYAFTTLSGPPDSAHLHLIIAAPERVAFAEADRILTRNLAGLGIVSILAFLAAWFGGDLFVLRHVNALVRATKRLSLGDLSARTGLPFGKGELGQLARSFDGMAESLERRYQQLKALHKIDMAITSTLDLRTTLDVLLEKIDSLFPNSATTVRLLNKESGELESVACQNLDEEEWKAATAKVRGGLSRMLPENNAPLMVLNAQTDPRSLSLDFLRKHGLVSYLRVPLTAKSEVLGVLTLFTKEEHEFTNEEVEFLTTLGSQAAIAIYNSQLYQQTKHQAIELEKSNKVKDEFLSVMSHELRTPLNVVMGYTGMIKDQMLGEINQKQEEALSKVAGRSMDLLNMINEILQVTSIEAQTVKVESHELSLHDFLDNLRSNYEAPLNKEVSLMWDYPSSLPVVKTDSEKLTHILQNLINNAIKFTAKGYVTITARYLAGEKNLEFKVADTGVGIPEEALPSIFERFRQVDSSETRRYGGVGMGLYIVKKFTELLGGTVEVESNLGKGSAFTVSLPVETVEEVKIGDAHAETNSFSRGRSRNN